MAHQVIKATSDRFKLAAYLHGRLQRRTSAVESMLSTFPGVGFESHEALAIRRTSNMTDAA